MWKEAGKAVSLSNLFAKQALLRNLTRTAASLPFGVFAFWSNILVLVLHITHFSSKSQRVNLPNTLLMSCANVTDLSKEVSLVHLRFRELREERKLSQSEMAKILHVSQQTYSRYESHKTEIPLEKLVYLAKFFDTSVNYLLGVEEK